MTAEGNGLVPSRPEDFRKISRKVVKLPVSGLAVEIRKLTGLDFLEAMGSLPLVTKSEKGGEVTDPAAEQKKFSERLRADPLAAAKSSEALVCKSVTSPRVVDKLPGECDKDSISVRDLGDDLNWLVTEIMSFSGLTEEGARVPGSFQEAGGSPSR